MKITTALSAIVFTAAVAALSAQSPSGPRPGVDWPGFRGINAGGVDDAAALPLQWNVPESKLVKWRVPVSGLGHSSPVVWGDLVCTASAISGTPDPQLKVGLYGDIGSVLDQTQHKWTIACFDKKTGKPLGAARTTGVAIVKQASEITHASSTLATDGRTIVAMSDRVVAYSMSGDCVEENRHLDSGSACSRRHEESPVARDAQRERDLQAMAEGPFVRR